MWEPFNAKEETCEQSQSSLAAATEAAARINALLIAKGVLKPSQVTTMPAKSKPAAEVRTFYCKLPQWAAASANGNVIIAEVDINKVPLSIRNHLTRPAMLEEITKSTGVTLSCRGRYISDDTKAEPGDRPLYLHLQSGSQDSIDKAVARIQEIIDGKDHRKEANRFTQSSCISSAQNKTNRTSSMAFLEEKLYIGLEHAPPNFEVRKKLLGPDGSYLLHIQNETGARIFLRGRNSGYIEQETCREACEPMHIFLQHQATSGLQQARELARSLIEMVQEEYVEFQQSLAAMPPPTLLAGLQPQSQSRGKTEADSVGVSTQFLLSVGLTLVGSSMPSSLSVMPMTATLNASSPLGFTIGPPVINPGSALVFDTSIPPPGVVAGTHAPSQPPTFTLGVIPSSMSSFMVDTSVPPSLGQPIVSIGGGLVSVQPATSFMLTQQAGALASGPIVLSQPVSGPADSFVLAPPGQAHNTIVLSHPAGPPIGQFVHQQLVLPAGAQIAVESAPGAGVSNEQQLPLALQTAPVFSQAGGRHIARPLSQVMLHGLSSACVSSETRAPPPVSVVQIASGSQVTMVQPSPSSESSVGGPSAIYTVTLPVSASMSSNVSNSETLSTTVSQDTARNGDTRKRRFTEAEDDYSNLLGYQHGPTHLVNTFVVNSASTVTSTSASQSDSDSQKATEARSVSISCWRTMYSTYSMPKTNCPNRSEWDIRLSAYGSQLTKDCAEQSEAKNSEVKDDVPVTQYSGKPQMYEQCTVQTDAAAMQDIAVTIYASSQPPSYLYQQTNTVTYQRLYQPSDTLSSYCSPVLSTPHSSAVYIQDTGAGQLTSLPPPTHFVIPPPPSVVSSVGQHVFTAPPQFSYGQGFEIQPPPPPVYQQSTPYAGFAASQSSEAASYSLIGALQAAPPPSAPPTNTTAVSYWMSLS